MSETFLSFSIMQFEVCNADVFSTSVLNIHLPSLPPLSSHNHTHTGKLLLTACATFSKTRVNIVVLSSRVTGAAVQVACEMRSGGRRSRAMSSDLSFSRLEMLECLWQDGQPEYSEVKSLFFCLWALTLVLRLMKYLGQPLSFLSISH